MYQTNFSVQMLSGYQFPFNFTWCFTARMTHLLHLGDVWHHWNDPDRSQNLNI